MRPRVLALIAAVAAMALAGCGEKADYVRFAETEGIYVDVGDLVYQVQLSRFLNPTDIEDREYLQGLPPDEVQPGPGEIWFAVFMRVKNYTDETLHPTREFWISDTEDNEYFPVKLPETNPFAYNPGPLGADQVYPRPDSAASSGPIQGSMILFKLKTESLQNRPLVLHIEQPGQDAAEIDLDL
jgi:hypothetical protein